MACDKRCMKLKLEYMNTKDLGGFADDEREDVLRALSYFMKHGRFDEDALAVLYICREKLKVPQNVDSVMAVDAYNACFKTCFETFLLYAERLQLAAHYFGSPIRRQGQPQILIGQAVQEMYPALRALYFGVRKETLKHYKYFTSVRKAGEKPLHVERVRDISQVSSEEKLLGEDVSVWAAVDGRGDAEHIEMLSYISSELNQVLTARIRASLVALDALAYEAVAHTALQYRAQSSVLSYYVADIVEGGADAVSVGDQVEAFSDCYKSLTGGYTSLDIAIKEQEGRARILPCKYKKKFL